MEENGTKGQHGLALTHEDGSVHVHEEPGLLVAGLNQQRQLVFVQLASYRFPYSSQTAVSHESLPGVPFPVPPHRLTEPTGAGKPQVEPSKPELVLVS